MKRSGFVILTAVGVLAAGVLVSPRLGLDVYLAVCGGIALVAMGIAWVMAIADRRSERELARSIGTAVQNASLAELDVALAADPAAPFCFVSGVAVPTAEARDRRAWLLVDGTVVRLPETPTSQKTRRGV